MVGWSGLVLNGLMLNVRMNAREMGGEATPPAERMKQEGSGCKTRRIETHHTLVQICGREQNSDSRNYCWKVQSSLRIVLKCGERRGSHGVRICVPVMAVMLWNLE